MPAMDYDAGVGARFRAEPDSHNPHGTIGRAKSCRTELGSSKNRAKVSSCWQVPFCSGVLDRFGGVFDSVGDGQLLVDLFDSRCQAGQEADG